MAVAGANSATFQGALACAGPAGSLRRGARPGDLVEGSGVTEALLDTRTEMLLFARFQREITAGTRRPLVFYINLDTRLCMSALGFGGLIP